jgi:gluconokinase
MFIGVDMGSGGVRAAVIDEAGKILAMANRPTPTRSGDDGQSTHSAAQLLDAVCQSIREAAELAGQTVAAVCLAGTAHALMTGTPDAPDDEIVLWSDGRSSTAHRRLAQAGYFEGYSGITGVPPHSAYWPAKIAWLRETGRLGPDRPWLFGEKDWIFQHLTGELLTDVSTAAATGLVDLGRLDWSEEFFGRLDAGWVRTTPVRPTTEIAALTPAAAHATGLPAGTPVVLGGVDGPLAHLGVGGTDLEVASLTIGTSLAVRRFTRQRPRVGVGKLWTYPLAPDAWVIGGAGSNGGSVLTWLASKLLPPGTDIGATLARIMERDPDPGLVFVPYLHGERAPVWDDRLSGGIVGLRPHHDAWDIARAGLEAIACMTHELGQTLTEITGDFSFAGLNGGFTASKAWSQLAVDAIGVPGAAPLEELAVIQGAVHLARAAVSDAPLTAERAPTGEPIQPDPLAHQRIKTAYQALAEVRPAFRQ